MTAQQKRQFAALRSLDAATKHELMPQMRRVLHRIAKAGSPFNAGLLLLPVGLAIGVSIEIPLLKWMLAHTNFSTPHGTVVFLIGLGLFYTLFFPIVRTGLTATYVTYSATLAAFGIAVSSHLNLGQHATLVIDFLGGAAGMGIFLMTLFIATLPWTLANTRRMLAHADAVFIHRLMGLIVQVEERPTEWNELSFRAGLVSKLDTIATLVEGNLRRAWRTRNPELSRWAGEYTISLASGVRSLGQWLISPRVDTRDRLLERLRDFLVCAVRGDWDGLPRLPIRSPELAERWFVRIFRIIRLLVASLIPIAALWLLTLLKLKLEDPAKTYLYAGAFLWAAIAWIAALDPLYQGKIEAIKSLLSFAGSEKAKGSRD